MVKLGIDRISEFPQLLKGKKIGLITNYSGVDSNLEEDLDVFVNAGQSNMWVSCEKILTDAENDRPVSLAAHEIAEDLITYKREEI